MIGDPTKLVIRAKFPRLSADAVAAFRERSTSFVVDAMNGRGALPHEIKPLDPSSRVVGSALTARAGARDNLAALAALDLIEPGDVLVIAVPHPEFEAIDISAKRVIDPWGLVSMRGPLKSC